MATTINALVGGIRVGKYSTGGRRLDVRLKLMAGQRSRPEDISRLRVRARNGELVPLSSLVLFEEQAALQAITRRDRERAISIFANVAPGHSQGEALRVIEGLGQDAARRQSGRPGRVEPGLPGFDELACSSPCSWASPSPT